VKTHRPHSDSLKQQEAHAGFFSGCLDILPMAVGAAPFGVIIGAMAIQAGLEPWEIVFMGAVVFAGAAQFIALDMWTSALLPGSVALAIIGTTLMVNLRHILMGAAAAPHIRGITPWVRYPYLYVMADETWAMTIRRARVNNDLGPAYLAGLALPFYLNWLVWSYVGTQIGDVINDPAVYGFDFVFTAVFVTLIFGFWKADRHLLPIIVSAMIALLAREVLPGTWYIFAGSVAGVLTAIITYREPSHE
jgi:4-azaleucine resistance transporter AzlC